LTSLNSGAFQTNRFGLLTVLFRAPLTMPSVVLFVQLLMLLGHLMAVDAQFRSPKSSSSLRTLLTYDLGDETPAGAEVGHVGRDSGLLHDGDFVGSGSQSAAAVSFMFRPGRLPSPFVSASDVAHLFSINPSTGSLVTSTAVDRDVICAGRPTCVIELDVQAQRYVSGRSSQPLISFIKVVITLADVNDNSPTFVDAGADPETVSNDPVTIVVSEGSMVGARIAALPVARDIDSPVNGVRRYALSSSGFAPSEMEAGNVRKPEEMFGVEVDASDDVYLVLRSRLDREVADVYTFALIAYDSGIPPLSGTTSVRIEITDVNDNVPVFDRVSYGVSVPENVAVGTVILVVHANDPDVGANGEVVYLLKRRNRKNGGHQAATRGPDEHPPFVIDPISGAISTSGSLDFESVSSYVLTVMAANRVDVSTENGSLGLSDAASFAHAQIIVSVTDVNDVIPMITFRSAFDGEITDTVHVSEALPVGAYVAHVTVVDSDPIGGNFECRCDDERNFHLEELFRGEYQVRSHIFGLLGCRLMDSIIDTACCTSASRREFF
jgi:hypothetical protein